MTPWRCFFFLFCCVYDMHVTGCPHTVACAISLLALQAYAAFADTDVHALLVAIAADGDAGARKALPPFL
jgi:hypothetical protein